MDVRRHGGLDALFQRQIGAGHVQGNIEILAVVGADLGRGFILLGTAFRPGIRCHAVYHNPLPFVLPVAVCGRPVVFHRATRARSRPR